MGRDRPTIPDSLPVDATRRVDAALDRFEAAWRAGQRPTIGQFLDGFDSSVRSVLLLNLVELDLNYRWESGDHQLIEPYVAEWPELQGDGQRLLRLVGYECELRLKHGDRPTVAEYRKRFTELDPDRISAHVEPLLEPVESADSLEPLEETIEHLIDNSQASRATASPHPLPEYIGRYRVVRWLGSGGFGDVYLAHDEQLDCLVAIKVPRDDRLASEHARATFLSEARHVARLRHPGIVRVYNFGEADGRCFLVYEYIEGMNLAQRMAQGPMAPTEAALLVAQVADALQHAHSRQGERGTGLYHRDIKPANILLDEEGQPHLTDFGLAVWEEDLPKEQGRRAGTHFYMAPEQARGEGNRIDGRTDIYSLGVVLYELLCGCRPFRSHSKHDLFDQILHRAPRPPRQIKDSIPAQLEQICLKALSKEMSGRFTTAKDMADDLRLAAAPPIPMPSSHQSESVPIAVTQPRAEVPARVVPKGLRSFGSEDSDFFLQLLPGPRDRHGLPESIRFWKTRIESFDLDRTFAVGLMYGPSGCGKSSLVCSGLLPQLAESVVPVYVEATRDDTESRLANALRKACPGLDSLHRLADMLTALRRHRGVAEGQKVLIVIDQFEQWLHGHGQEMDTSELVLALRQADGEHVSVLLLVRDDFWMGISRFFEKLYINLDPDRNTRVVDLFDLDHARHVLCLFGQAFDRLPCGHAADLSGDQQKFLNQAVHELSENGRVISVRLSLFADLMKDRDWTLASLLEIGGASGVGLRFLEDTFSTRSAVPERRVIEKPARILLQALLPEPGTEIKGHLRSRPDLAAATGLAESSPRFTRLVDILDQELHLITPSETDQGSFYQLTHDYLVPPLRQWLTLERRKSWRGRAELCLEERTNQMSRWPQSRYLPSLLEYLAITFAFRPKRRKPDQKALMRAATRHYAVRSAIVLMLGVAIVLTALTVRRPYERAAELTDKLMVADITLVPEIIDEMKGYRRWVNPRLHDTIENPKSNDKQRMQARMALLEDDVQQLQYLERSMLKAEPDELLILRQMLMPHAGALKGRLWAVLENRSSNPKEAFRCACALALLDPENDRWNSAYESVVSQLVLEDWSLLSSWAEVLRPMREPLAEHLKAVLADSPRPAERHAAAIVLAVFLRDEPDELVELIYRAEGQQVGVLARGLSGHRRSAIVTLAEKLDEISPQPHDSKANNALAKARANAAVALLLLDDPRGWALLPHRPDPQARSYFIHALAPAEAKAEDVIRRLDEEKDVSAIRALILSLGQYKNTLNLDQWGSFVDELLKRYGDDGDCGIHGATEWLLRLWKREGRLTSKQMDRFVEIDEQHRRRFSVPPPDRQWYVNSQGQTMVVFRGPIEFTMGSPAEDPERTAKEELPHVETIRKSIAISATEVTVGQFLQLCPEFVNTYIRRSSPAVDCPINFVSLQDVAVYCERLSEAEGIHDPEHLYRLPTEAEWEYACRANTTTSRYFGDSESLLSFYAWCQRTPANPTRPVKYFMPNEFGLFDMYGNIMEWCQDSALQPVEQEKRYQRFPDRSAPPRWVRGGYLGSEPQGTRSAYRFENRSSRQTTIGFRVVRTLP